MKFIYKMVTMKWVPVYMYDIIYSENNDDKWAQTFISENKSFRHLHFVILISKPDIFKTLTPKDCQPHFLNILSHTHPPPPHRKTYTAKIQTNALQYKFSQEEGFLVGCVCVGGGGNIQKTGLGNLLR